VTNDCNAADKVVLTLRRGVILTPEAAKEFEAGVRTLVQDMFRSDAKILPIEVAWSKECYQGRTIEVDVVVRLLAHEITDISPFAIFDFWIQMANSWMELVTFVAHFGLGIVVLDKSGHPYNRITRDSICRLTAFSNNGS